MSELDKRLHVFDQYAAEVAAGRLTHQEFSWESEGAVMDDQTGRPISDHREQAGGYTRGVITRYVEAAAKKRGLKCVVTDEGFTISHA